MGKPDKVRVGSGAGTSDDRMLPALELAQRGNLDFLVFECLAERTVARECLTRSHNPDKGYTPSLHERLRMVLPTCLEKRTRIITNMGAANPLGGAKAARREARDLGLGDVPCAVVLGDDITDTIRSHPELPLMEGGAPLESLLPRLVSANAYLGADVVCQALATGAPMVTGGCFGWPRKKEVPNLAAVGYPFADAGRSGTVSIGKTPDSGGRLDVMTCSEQLIYEIHVAHCRAGDKGNTSNISVIAYDEKDWEFLRRELTPERVTAAFAHIAAGPVRRYELPNLKAFNFIIENALGGGVTISIAQDIHGKSLSNVMRGIELPERG